MFLQCNSLLTVCQATKTFTDTGNQSLRNNVQKYLASIIIQLHYNGTGAVSDMCTSCY